MNNPKFHLGLFTFKPLRFYIKLNPLPSFEKKLMQIFRFTTGLHAGTEDEERFKLYHLTLILSLSNQSNITTFSIINLFISNTYSILYHPYINI